MSERARTLATRLEQVSEEVVAFVRQCPDEDWRAITKEEQWPVCSVCRHIARGFELDFPHLISGVPIQYRQSPSENCLSTTLLGPRQYTACSGSDFSHIGVRR